jgi:hypothetical protein
MFCLDSWLLILDSLLFKVNPFLFGQYSINILYKIEILQSYAIDFINFF